MTFLIIFFFVWFAAMGFMFGYDIAARIEARKFTRLITRYHWEVSRNLHRLRGSDY